MLAAKRRAEAAGFDSETLLFHGTIAAADFTGFAVGKGFPRELGAGVYLTTSPEHASVWACRGRAEWGRIIPVWVRRGELLDRSTPVDYLLLAQRIRRRHAHAGWPETDAALAMHIREGGARQLNGWLARAGYVGAFIPAGDEPHQMVVFHPRNIRSPWARFDPAQAHSADLLA